MRISAHTRVGRPNAGRFIAAAWAVVLAGDLLALGTIGASRGTAVDDASPEQPAVTSAPGVDAHGSPTTTPPKTPLPAGTVGGAGQAPPTTAPLGAVRTDGWDFPATLTPNCGRAGQVFRLALNVGPKGSGVLSVVYGDGVTRGPHTFFEGGADGSYSYTWVAAAAPGDGMLLVVASDANRANSGTKAIPFRIVGPADRC